ncbi:MarR family transcriptional regulator, partial [Candidatus Saccharibacteria bacterium]|nr:MarR family transcriptional regulator [Candidatus Saccharibacteria bacterium]
IKDPLPAGQKTALFIIAQKEAINIKQLAELLKITSGAATQQVEGLVTRALVQRVTNPDDRRGVSLSLSKKGIQLHSRMTKNRQKFVEKIFSSLDDRELTDFKNAMLKISKSLEKG